MKTILITSFHPLISRNILSAGVLERLLERPDLRVVLLVPAFKKDFFELAFGRPRIVVEGVAVRFGRMDRFLRYLSHAVLRTASLEIKRRAEMRGSGVLLSRLIGERSLGRTLVRFFASFLPVGQWGAVFEAYRPSLVFAADVVHDVDTQVMAAGRRWGVPVVAMVRSWDNLTSKGLVRVVPDRLAVHNQIEAREAVTIHGIAPERVAVVGLPHYDSYLDLTDTAPRREEFFSSLGLDPDKRLVLYAPIGNRYIAENTVDRDIVEMLDLFLPQEWQILVRLPPSDSVSHLDGRNRDGRVVYERPASGYFRTPKNAELLARDDARLRDTLFWSDMVVAGPSTMCVDAAVFDKPVILIGFDGWGSEEVGRLVNLPYQSSVRRYYDYNHFAPVLQSGGVRLVANIGEFRDALEAYGNDPTLDRAGRRRIVEEQCGTLDGRASDRLANVLLSTLDRS